MFSLFKVSNGVLKELEKLRRNFFWGGNDDQKCIPWVSWDKIQMDKEKGGLGVGNLGDLNNALLAKWYWRYRSAKEALWVQIIKSLHGYNTVMEDGSNIKTGTTWKNIVKVLQKMKIKNVDPRSKIKVEICNGKNTSFWNDWWIGERRLGISSCLQFRQP